MEKTYTVCVLKKRVPRNIFAPKEDIASSWSKMHNKELEICNPS
jgi:hypothetical protein